jgi:hypothetical protein
MRDAWDGNMVCGMFIGCMGTSSIYPLPLKVLVGGAFHHETFELEYASYYSIRAATKENSGPVQVNMLAREYCDDIKRKMKPIVLSHRMMPGLLEGQEKMSKSDPNSAIFMEDSEAEVNVKIKKAYCPPQVEAAGRGLGAF